MTKFEVLCVSCGLGGGFVLALVFVWFGLVN